MNIPKIIHCNNYYQYAFVINNLVIFNIYIIIINKKQIKFYIR